MKKLIFLTAFVSAFVSASTLYVAENYFSKSFTYSGGQAGYVRSVIKSEADVSIGVQDYIWGILSVLNSSALAGENVAIYAQANRMANDGPLWGMVSEVRDASENSVGALVGAEVNLMANGSSSGNRVGVDVVVGRGSASGAENLSDVGVRVNSSDGSSVEVGFHSGATRIGGVGFLSDSPAYASFKTSGSVIYGYLVSGSAAVGMDTTSATLSTNNAIRIKAGQKIALEETGTITIEYDPHQGAIVMKNGVTVKHIFSM